MSFGNFEDIKTLATQLSNVLASEKSGNQKGNEDKKATEVFQGQVHFYKNHKIINKPFLMSNQMLKAVI